MSNTFSQPSWFPLPAELHWKRFGSMPSTKEDYRDEVLEMMQKQRGIANTLDVASLLECTSDKARQIMRTFEEDGTVEVIARSPKTWRLV